MRDTVPFEMVLLLLGGGYLLGSIPFAFVLGRLTGMDLRYEGTRNIGAGNLTKLAGIGWGATAALLDASKGIAPVVVARQLGLGPGTAGVVGMMAVVGHNWSAFMRGRSGRGMATSAGMVAALDPVLLVWTAAWSVAGWRIGGGLGGFMGWFFLPVVAVFLGRELPEVYALSFLSIVLVGRRMQGNPDSPRGLRPALHHALHDTDADGYEEQAADHPLTS